MHGQSNGSKYIEQKTRFKHNWVNYNGFGPGHFHPNPINNYHYNIITNINIK